MNYERNRSKKYIVDSPSFSFGIYFGMFFSFIIQQIMDGYHSSLILTAYSEDLTFSSIIQQCSMLSERVLWLSVFGIVILFVLLFIVHHLIDTITWDDEIEIMLIIISLIIWLIVPIAIISTSIQNTLLNITLVADNIPSSELALLSENYKFLFQFWYLGNSFSYEIKMTILSVSILFSSTLIKLHNSKMSKKKLITILLLPLVLAFILEIFLIPTVKGIIISTGEIGVGIGGTGIIGPDMPIYPFYVLSPVLFGVSYFLILI